MGAAMVSRHELVSGCFARRYRKGWARSARRTWGCCTATETELTSFSLRRPSSNASLKESKDEVRLLARRLTWTTSVRPSLSASVLSLTLKALR